MSALPRPSGELLVVTPWYPNVTNPYAGTFVRESVRSVAPYYENVTIIHVENRTLDDTREPYWSETPEGRVLWIGVPMDPMTSRGGMMLAQREALQAHAPDLLRSADVIHCHVGAPTGAALVPLIRDDTRLVLTEHATYLSKIFRDPQARAMYEAVYRRAEVFTAVSSVTARFIEDAFPGARDFVTVVPNPVLLQNLPVKTDLSTTLSRWLYVGNLVEHKGVRRLVRSFAQWVKYTRDDAASLTIVGAGPLHDDLVALAAELGVADRVEFTGAVEPDQIGSVYLAHDVLVHLSHIETFGLTSVEAAACGLPVIVTQSGGPQDTMALAVALGLAHYVPVEDEMAVESVVEAMTALQRSVDPANITISRHHLQRSYSSETIGAILHSALVGEPLPQEPIHEGMRVLAVALTAREARTAEAALQHFASLGGGGVYLAGRPQWYALPPSIRVIDISGLEERFLLYKLERALVLRGPALGLRAARKASSLVGRVAPALGKRAAAAVQQLQGRHQQLARDVRHGPYDLIWRNIGPWYVARTMDAAGTLEALDMSQFDCFIMPDEFITPIAYRAAKLNPELDVRRRWTRTHIARLYADRVLLPAHMEPEDDDPEVEIEVPQEGPIP